MSVIEINGLSTGYIRNDPFIYRMNGSFEANKIYGILGPSGVGKTTFLRTVAGLTKPLEGKCLLDLKNVFMMHQSYTSFDWLTCINNILIAQEVKTKRITEEDRAAALDMLKRVGLEGYEDKYPAQLSGGMRQRLALARTLYTKPGILLMDEPMSALDSKTRRQMQDLVLDMHRETKNTILLVTHDEEEARRMCDEVIYLKGGRTNEKI